MTRNECEHGQLRRSCQICDLVEERDEWKAQAEGEAIVAGSYRDERDALAAHVEEVADALGFPPHNENRHRTSVIVTNIENTRRFADYLHAIEQAFLMAPGEPDDDCPGEVPDDECLVNCWGAKSREAYIEQFRQALAKLKAKWQAEALDGVAMEWRRDEMDQNHTDCVEYLERKADNLRRQGGGDV